MEALRRARPVQGKPLPFNSARWRVSHGLVRSWLCVLPFAADSLHLLITCCLHDFLSRQSPCPSTCLLCSFLRAPRVTLRPWRGIIFLRASAVRLHLPLCPCLCGAASVEVPMARPQRGRSKSAAICFSSHSHTHSLHPITQVLDHGQLVGLAPGTFLPPALARIHDEYSGLRHCCR